ncbi:MAG TPA: hypothetical protein VF076_07230 [Acidimicrobiales bacterium]
MTHSTRKLAQGKLTRPTRADLQATVERLERAEAHLAERCRSLQLLLERAEADRDTHLMRLSTCAEENGRRRQMLLEARATIARLEAKEGRADG